MNRGDFILAAATLDLFDPIALEESLSSLDIASLLGVSPSLMSNAGSEEEGLPREEIDVSGTNYRLLAAQPLTDAFKLHGIGHAAWVLRLEIRQLALQVISSKHAFMDIHRRVSRAAVSSRANSLLSELIRPLPGARAGGIEPPKARDLYELRRWFALSEKLAAEFDLPSQSILSGNLRRLPEEKTVARLLGNQPAPDSEAASLVGFLKGICGMGKWATFSCSETVMKSAWSTLASGLPIRAASCAYLDLTRPSNGADDLERLVQNIYLMAGIEPLPETGTPWQIGLQNLGNIAFPNNKNFLLILGMDRHTRSWRPRSAALLIIFLMECAALGFQVALRFDGSPARSHALSIEDGIALMLRLGFGVQPMAAVNATLLTEGLPIRTMKEIVASLTQRRGFVHGLVRSAKMQKTLVVTNTTRSPHPRYCKIVTRIHKFYAHDDKELARRGDYVLLRPTRPLSKTKRWRLVAVLARPIE
ncbi:MAG: 30S ribosomal protein S17 [Chthoniobacteraceae bacterium]